MSATIQTNIRRLIHPGFLKWHSTSKVQRQGMFDLEALCNSDAVQFGPPFDDDDADLILRSSDSVDFPVHQAFLSKASSFFKLMLSLPQPPASTHPAKRSNNRSVDTNSLPVVPVVENSTVLHILLSFILPIEPILPSSLDEALDFVNATIKYEMDFITTRARLLLRTFLTVETCLRIYVFAHRHGFQDETIAAARLSLKLSFSLDDPVCNLIGLHGAASRDLQKYRKSYMLILQGSIQQALELEYDAKRWGWTVKHPYRIDEWIKTRICKTEKCSNNCRVWYRIFGLGCQHIQNELSSFPERIPLWNFPVRAELGSGLCHSSKACSALRNSPHKVEQDLIEFVEQIVSKKIVSQIDPKMFFRVG